MYSPIDIDLVIVMDTTGSMSRNINAAKSRAKTILEEFRSDADVATLRAGFIAYRDYGDEMSTYLTITHPLTPNLEDLQNFINGLNAHGGADESEAWDCAAVEINSLFRSGKKDAGRIVAWIADNPPHGAEYNCGQSDFQRPIRADLKAEIEEAIGNDAHFYFMLYPPMSTQKHSCASKYLKPWGEILALGDDARSSSADDIKTILHHGVLQAIARREIRDGMKRGKSREDIIDGLLDSGIPFRELWADGDKVATRDSDLTRDGAEDLVDKAIRIKPKRAKDIGDRILIGGPKNPDDKNGDLPWLGRYVASLGDEILQDLPGKIQYVHSKQHPLKRGKKGKYRHWWALDESYLDKMSEGAYLDFVSRVLDTKGSQKTIFLTNCGTSKMKNPKRNEVLKGLSKTTVIELNIPNVPIPPNPPIPSPWPNPPKPSPDGYDGERDTDGRNDDSDFNCVPGIPPAPCRRYLLVIPEVDCDKLRESDYTFENRKHPDHRIWDCDEYHEWRPDLESMPREEVKENISAWEKMRQCFCRILESAVGHAASCLENTGGKMNQTIIVQMSRRGIEMGLLSHPCYICFEKAVKKLNQRWKHVNGVALVLQVVR